MPIPQPRWLRTFALITECEETINRFHRQPRNDYEWSLFFWAERTLTALPSAEDEANWDLDAPLPPPFQPTSADGHQRLHAPLVAAAVAVIRYLISLNCHVFYFQTMLLVCDKLYTPFSQPCFMYLMFFFRVRRSHRRSLTWHRSLTW